MVSSSSPLVPRGMGATSLSLSRHLDASSPSTEIFRHSFPLSDVHLCPFETFLLTPPFHLNFDLPLLLLPPSCVFHVLFVNLVIRSLYVSCRKHSSPHYIHLQVFLDSISSLNSPSSFCPRLLLYIFSEHSCSLLHVASPPVSLSV